MAIKWLKQNLFVMAVMTIYNYFFLVCHPLLLFPLKNYQKKRLDHNLIQSQQAKDGNRPHTIAVILFSLKNDTGI